jgi:hypothetical protein
MHRSGTSAIAGSLGLLGCNLGKRLLEAGPDNRKGYFENTDAVLLNERALAAVGSSWSDFRALPNDWMRDDEIRRLVPVARRTLARLASDGPWALKDPRLCPLLDLWRVAASGLGAMAVLAVRHPCEVAHSLRKRDGMPHLPGVLLWLRYVQDAIQGSETMPRTVVDYDRLLRNPVAALDGLAGDLGVEWPNRPASVGQQLSDFLSSERHHVSAPGQELEDCDPELTARACEIHAGLVGGKGETALAEALDRLRAAQLYIQSSDWGKWLSLLQEGIAETSAREMGRHRRERHTMLMRLRALEAARGAAESLALERMARLAALDAGLVEARQALERAERLTGEHMHEISNLQQRLVASQALVAQQEDRIERLVLRAASAEELAERTQRELTRITQAWWWHLLSPVLGPGRKAR